MMQTSNNNSIFNDPEWYFLGEYTLSELVADVDLRGGEFMVQPEHQIIGDLGIPPECLDNIERTLTKFAENAVADVEHGRSELPVFIRTFCPKKTVANINSLKYSSRFTTQHRLKPMNIFHHSDAEINGGWGFFLVDRIGSSTPDSTVGAYKLVDLYLYREGE